MSGQREGGGEQQGRSLLAPEVAVYLATEDQQDQGMASTGLIYLSDLTPFDARVYEAWYVGFISLGPTVAVC